MRKTCTQIEDHVAAFVYGGLNQRARAVVEEHIASCPRCGDQIRALEEERVSLRQLVADLDADMGKRLDGIRQRLETEPLVERSERPRLSHRPVTGRMARLGAAAAILLATLMLLMHLGNGSVDFSNTAMARVAEAMGNVPWVHLHATILMDGKSRHYEDWLSNRFQINAERDEDGRITWSEAAARRKAVYSPDHNTIVISYAAPTPTGSVINPSGPIDTFQKLHGTGDAEITVERGRHDGIDVDIYKAREYGGRGEGRYLRSRHKLVADRARHLILVTEQYNYLPDGTLFHSCVGPWDYPQEGPKDIYDIGAPRTARVLDFSPSRELLKVLDRYEAMRDTFPDQYVAVMQHCRYDAAATSHMIDGVHIFCSDGVLKRADSLYCHPIDRKEFAAECGDTFETLMSWWERRGSSSVVVEQQSVSLYDEEHAYSTYTTPDGSWQPLRKRYAPARKDRPLWNFAGEWTPYGDVLAELGYPRQLLHSQPTKIAILQDDYAKDNALICIELLYDGQVSRSASGSETTVSLPRRRLFYLDPNRDYFCRREEVRSDIDASWPTDLNWLDGVPRDQREGNMIFDKTGRAVDVVHGVKRAVVVRDVPEYDRTDSGRWYPKQIVTHGHAELCDGTVTERQLVTTIHLDTNPTFHDGTFDPGQLSQ